LSVGTTVGGTQIYAGYQGSSLSRTVSGLPTNGSTVHVRLRSWIGSSWQTRDYTYTAFTQVTAQASTITTPAPGSTLLGGTVTFNWTAGGLVTSRFLSVGTTPGGTEIYGADQGTALSRSVSGLPTNGSTVYVRLRSTMGAVSENVDYQYTSVLLTQASAMTSPTPGSTLTSSSATFSWSAGSGVTERYLMVGTGPGAGDLYSGYQGAGLSRTVSGLPTNGGTIYVRLQSWIGSGWRSSDYTYTASGVPSGPPPTPGPSALTSPAPGATLDSTTVTFTWSAGTAVSERYFAVGTTPGASNIYGGYQGAGLSRTVSGLPSNGSTVHVRLMSWVNGGWQSADYTYTATGGAVAPTPSAMTSPAAGSTLGASATFAWTAGSGVTERYLAVGTSPGSSNIYGAYQGASVSRTVSGIPLNGATVHVTLSSWISGAWQTRAYTYTAGTP
jgi:hypothetical protein